MIFNPYGGILGPGDPVPGDELDQGQVDAYWDAMEAREAETAAGCWWDLGAAGAERAVVAGV